MVSYAFRKDIAKHRLATGCVGSKNVWGEPSWHGFAVLLHDTFIRSLALRFLFTVVSMLRLSCPCGGLAETLLSSSSLKRQPVEAVHYTVMRTGWSRRMIILHRTVFSKTNVSSSPRSSSPSPSLIFIYGAFPPWRSRSGLTRPSHGGLKSSVGLRTGCGLGPTGMSQRWFLLALRRTLAQWSIARKS